MREGMRNRLAARRGDDEPEDGASGSDSEGDEVDGAVSTAATSSCIFLGANPVLITLVTKRHS